MLPGNPAIENSQSNVTSYTTGKMRNRRSSASYVFLVTYVLSIGMLLLTIAYLYSLGGLPLRNFLKLQVSPYFFILILLVKPPSVSLLAVVIFIIIGYAVVFAVLGAGFNSAISPIDSSNGFYSMMAPVLLIVSLIITVAEESLGIPILGQQAGTTAYYRGFVDLVYAPFVEELGFRILPLGIITFIPFVMHIRQPSNVSADQRKYIVPPVKSFFLYLVSPGYYRSRYGGRNREVDLILIFVTSGIFAYAHIYYGAWSWGKLLPIFVDGIILAVGYLKFGLYVDIPLHWFINDFAGLEIVEPSTLPFLIFVLIWCMFACVIGIIFSIPSIRRFFRSRGYT